MRRARPITLPDHPEQTQTMDSQNPTNITSNSNNNKPPSPMTPTNIIINRGNDPLPQIPRTSSAIPTNSNANNNNIISTSSNNIISHSTPTSSEHNTNHLSDNNAVFPLDIIEGLELQQQNLHDRPRQMGRRADMSPRNASLNSESISHGVGMQVGLLIFLSFNIFIF